MESHTVQSEQAATVESQNASPNPKHAQVSKEAAEAAVPRDEVLENFRRMIVLGSPYATGTLPLPPSDFVLFYTTEAGETRSLDLAQASVEQLEQLADACAPATFGRGQQDVLDESYRRAGKMDSSQFTTRIVPERTELLDVVRDELLEGEQSKRLIICELYKLNIYGENAFFKAHIDTPRGTNMFGSLVVIFPTQHEGGNLIFRTDGQEFNFDAAAALKTVTEPSIAYATFFSDIEHEVAVVTTGKRVSLTFNLYFGDIEPGISVSPPTATPASYDAFCGAVEAMLNNDDVFPNGITLAFPMRHVYPVKLSDNREYLSHVHKILKGPDAMVHSVFETLGFQPRVYMFYHMRGFGGQVKFFIRRPLVFPPWASQVEVSEELVREWGGIVVRGSGPDEDRPLGWPRSRPDEEVYWVSPPKIALEKQTFLAYGNQACMGYAYRSLYIVVRIGPAGKRMEFKTWV
ncbi:hypothetical protein K488DRAFT_82255 [Vararia minispora EC-137]|uniref:Uncharacterized protein n=1 Tax=Vararia minispora EC-137 TaxID=1314806 RepID=A0ACB8QX91_9AGAM|nr:hypothetical protein K488DRAFT_82255 [Vararia minispora EC-137]